jgi:hypothetical protein
MLEQARLTVHTIASIRCTPGVIGGDPGAAPPAIDPDAAAGETEKPRERSSPFTSSLKLAGSIASPGAPGWNWKRTNGRSISTVPPGLGSIIRIAGRGYPAESFGTGRCPAESLGA